MRYRGVGALMLLWVVTGCHVSYVQRAESAYRDGRYLEAFEQLAPHEKDVTRMSPRGQARYGMMRGLTLVGMGDYVEAKRWLRYAYDVEETQPSLRADERAELDAAWRKIQN